MKKKVYTIVSFAAMIAVMICIFMFSAQVRDESNNLSRGITAKIIDIFPLTAHHSPEQKQQDITVLNDYVRKCAHFVIYALLGFFAGASFYMMRKYKMNAIPYLCATAFCCLYAASDEIHQGFVDGRGPMVRDVILDTVGAAVGAAAFMAALLLYRKIKRKRTEEKL